ncbi:RagB/SusD family nutrient uptake outer membrane protein [Polaribacter butkevichii]|uniref:RagB/SusD family nutrient uptake outer membrane protein n=1 Tax=Polaribacter butkevichii TaxID=218490 RepID=A0A2P6CCK7_9FLAO|nr:RagB/SusD family nutrient uptake outer membrane protein [Polaribacter butkevichii]PQJ72644.1 hypothetical protein BTO14_04960 [Polaribacter butkevichii]
MKKSKYILSTLLVFILLFSSCSETLELTPISEVSDEVFWKTNDDAELGIVSIYDAMQKTYRVKHFLWGDFRSDDYVISDKPQPSFESLINNKLEASQENYLRWDNFYTMIFRANLAIEKIPEITSYNKNLLGEAYALRAYAYFDAYRVWGGVPIFKEATLTFDETSFRARATAQEVLDLALSDLAEAEKLITTPSTQNATRFTEGSLLAFKAKVLMFLKRYDEANVVLQKIIDLGVYSLTTDRTAWGNLFLNDKVLFPGQGQEGPEIIMSLKFDVAEDGNRASGVWELHYPGVPAFWVSPEVRSKWIFRFPIDEGGWQAKYPGITAPSSVLDEETGLQVPVYGDYRFLETITEHNGSIEDLRVSKYSKGNYSPREDDTNIILFRYADMLLYKAEAEHHLGNTDAAIKLLDEVRVARGLPKVNSGVFADVDVTDKDAMLNFILDERQFELFAEGTRWWDLVRTDKAVEVLGPINGQTEATITWPIYFLHLQNNTKLEQNEAYK